MHHWLVIFKNTADFQTHNILYTSYKITKSNAKTITSQESTWISSTLFNRTDFLFKGRTSQLHKERDYSYWVLLTHYLYSLSNHCSQNKCMFTFNWTNTTISWNRGNSELYYSGIIFYFCLGLLELCLKWILIHLLDTWFLWFDIWSF